MGVECRVNTKKENQSVKKCRREKCKAQDESVNGQKREHDGGEMFRERERRKNKQQQKVSLKLLIQFQCSALTETHLCVKGDS